MTQNNQTSTSKQNSDKEQHARELNEQVEKEQKQNEIDKKHNQEVLEAQKHNTDEKSEARQGTQPGGEHADQKDNSNQAQSGKLDQKTESIKMDDLKAKAIAIGEDLLKKAEKILNELKNGKSDSQQTGEQGSGDTKKAKADYTSKDKSANQSDQQDRMAHFKDEALHKFEDTKQKITELVNEASVKLGELRQMATDTMSKMKGEDQSQSGEPKKQDQDKTDQSEQNKPDQNKNHQ
ncbi:hypothetical protein GCM10023345_27410 [Acinetobacter kookii]|uniref:Uncharacterized protein n=1 Tax=Acinetobacter kookii TaxID=1226327 RepID=A0A1G6KV84_9GAMM|nr:hypothetical protein [Acinetobacter kookii]SDC34405.1 hypothetical protein SAMN05421732_105136 [Acinetobacter kookii]